MGGHGMNALTPQWRRVEGNLIAHSVDVAEFFDKQHAHVTRDIEELLSISPILERSSWFTPTTYRDASNRSYQAWRLSFEGFALLVMGWTGPKALDFKIAWIEAFKAQGGVISFVSDNLPDAFTDDRKLWNLIRQNGEQSGRIEDSCQKLNAMMSKVDRKTDFICEGVSEVRREVKKRRAEFAEPVVRELLWAARHLGGRCPCCGKREVLDASGERVNAAQLDHFFANHYAKVGSGWLICGECHSRLNNDVELRQEVIPQFRAFHNQRKNLGPMQGSLLQ
jgi:Rha family phage regulatory protein